MLPRARQEHLLRQLELHGSVVAADIARDLKVNQVTIRRDIAELDRSGLLTRVHGGAIRTADPDGRPRPAPTLVGVVVPSGTVYFPDVLHGMKAAAQARRIRLMLGISHYDAGAERQRVERMLDLGVEGLIIAPTLVESQLPATTQWLHALPVPTVILERRVEDPSHTIRLDSARTDHLHGALLAMEHLRDLGHQQVALACFDRTPTAKWVRIGFDEGLCRLGMKSGPMVSLPKGEDEPRELNRLLHEFLDRCQVSGARAAVVHSDYHAARLVEVADSRGVRVPEDLAVVAYDDELAAMANVPLSAITSPRRRLGQESVRLLHERLAPVDDLEHPPAHVEILPRLTIRDSCGARSRSRVG